MKRLLFSFLLSLTLNVCAQVELRLLEGETYLRKGLISKVTLITKDQTFLNEIKKSQGSISLNEWIYLLGVEFINETDGKTFSIGATVILKNLPQTKTMEITLSEKKYNLNLSSVSFHPDDASLAPKAIVIDQPFSLNTALLWFKENIKTMIVASLFLFVLLVYGVRKVIKLAAKKRNKKENIDKWRNAILNASTRVDVEFLYKHRRSWTGIFPQLSEENFLKFINSIQYAPHWSKEQFDKVHEELEALKKRVR